MSIKSFKKGVHPYEGKELSKDCPIKSISADDIMVYPLSQHIGAPAQCVVSAGDRVLKGQMIAQASGTISAPVYSSVSGTVKAVEKRAVCDGTVMDCIVIENDREDKCVDGFGEDRRLESLTAQQIAEIIKNSGIVGLGGAGFPTAVKVTPKNADGIDTLIINGCECEPYLTYDYRLMMEKGAQIIEGTKAVLKLLPNAKAVIAIEDNKPDAIKAMEELVASYDRMTVQPVKTKYPQGGERQLIYAITKRKINSKMLPADKGVIVVNTATCVAVYEAVCKNMPLIHRVMTVTGEGVNSPCNLDVPLGVSHAYVLEKAGGAKEDAVKFISGGPMMGVAMCSLDVPVVKTSSSILVFIQDDVSVLPQSACIHCGKCVSVCPQNLVPQMMAKAVKSDDFKRFEDVGGMECIGCGCCAYACPAKIPLIQLFKYGKASVINMRNKD